MDISRWIEYWADWTPDKIALRFEDRSISYAELDQEVARTAAWLREKEVGRGDRVAFLGPNCPELLELFFACARIGAIFVPLNARMPAAELSGFIRLSEPCLFVSERELHAAAAAAAPILPSSSIPAFSIGSGELLATTGGMKADTEADPTTPLLITFTSGTTGTPKGAVHSNGGVISNATDAVTALGIVPTDQILTVLPMFHVAGLNILTVPALSMGATVTVHRRFEPQAALEDIEGFGVTLFLATPPLTKAMAADPRWSLTNLSSVRALLIGGTVVAEDAIRAWQERSVPVTQGYGMTEVGPVATLVPHEAIPRKTLTAGKPTLHTRIRVVDRDGRDLPPGQPGEVLIQSPSVTTGYWRNSEATREAITDGWFKTGDLGLFDDEGFLHIVDRLKEIIIVGVSNVYPGDLEAVLTESPHIAEAAVVALPDDELGEIPVAFIVRTPGSAIDEESVLALFHGRLAPYKHPRHVAFMDSLPRTSVGKVEKKTLRALALSRFARARDEEAAPDGRLQPAAR